MTKEVYYGLDYWEQLEATAEDAIERIIEDEWKPEERFGDVADRLEWPLKVMVFEQMTLDPDDIAGGILERALDDLDEEYADPEGGPTDTTKAMKDAALKFAEVIASEYRVWRCEPTDQILEFAREEVEKDYDDDD